MASKKRRAYSGTPEQHLSDAAHYTKKARYFVKETLARANAGKCSLSLESFEAAAKSLGVSSASKAYSHHRRGGGTNRLTTPYSMLRGIQRARRAVAACFREK